MTMFTDEHGEVIHVPFPEQKFKAYLKMAHLTTYKDGTLSQQRNMFLYIIADFKSGKLSLDEMSALAGEMYSYPDEQDSVEFTELNDALYDCSELNFYVRRILEIKSNPRGSEFINMMLTVMKYYQNYQHCIQHELDHGMRTIVKGGKVAVLQELVKGMTNQDEP